MSDRIAVMHGGRVVQVDTPEGVYERPATRFVAEFIGTSNFLTGRMDGTRLLVDGLGAVPVPEGSGLTGEAHLAVRPENVRVCHNESELPPGRAALPATLQQVVYLGSTTRHHLTLANGDTFVAETHGAEPGGVSAGGQTWVHWDPRASRLLPE